MIREVASGNVHILETVDSLVRSSYAQCIVTSNEVFGDFEGYPLHMGHHHRSVESNG
jgi:hypothetical protein